MGVVGVAPLIAQWLTAVEQWLFAGAALWLGVYGLMRGYDAWRGMARYKRCSSAKWADDNIGDGGGAFGNPHVYLDTIVLIGRVAAI